MKGYKIPELRIHRFDSDEILTGSAYLVDGRYEDITNKAIIDWEKNLNRVDKVNTMLTFN